MAEATGAEHWTRRQSLGEGKTAGALVWVAAGPFPGFWQWFRWEEVLEGVRAERWMRRLSSGKLKRVGA